MLSFRGCQNKLFSNIFIQSILFFFPSCVGVFLIPHSLPAVDSNKSDNRRPNIGKGWGVNGWMESLCVVSNRMKFVSFFRMKLTEWVSNIQIYAPFFENGCHRTAHVEHYYYIYAANAFDLDARCVITIRISSFWGRKNNIRTEKGDE